MIVKAPVNSLRAAKLQCRYGAKEIYLGLKNESLNKISFTGRGSIKIDNSGTNSNIQSEEELQEIIKYCHGENVKVAFAANCPSLPDSMKKEYAKYIENVLKLGIDSIIVGDLSSLLLVKEIVPEQFEISSSVFFDNYNEGGVEMMKSLGVNDVIIPHHLNMEEIEKLTKLGIKIGVFANYGCSFSNGRCGLVHRWGEDIDMGLPCRAKFYVKDGNGVDMGIDNILDFGLDCCICSLKKLIERNVHSIKLIDRATPVEQVLPFTKVYSTAINMLEENKSIEEVKQMAFKIVPWWEEQFCTDKKCRYIENSYSKYYI